MEPHHRKSELASETTRRKMILTTAAALAALTTSSSNAQAAGDSGPVRTAEAIHQGPIFDPPPQQLYEALTDAKQFDQVMRLSDAMRSMAPGTAPAVISLQLGGAFSLFGGYISGRQLELEPDRLIVQAWHSQSWKPTDYSIARFQLVPHGAGTKIIFDHRGFPDGTSASLAEGWQMNYWDPLRKFLSPKK
jgi:activator of HSP90 ATPase